MGKCVFGEILINELIRAHFLYPSSPAALSVYMRGERWPTRRLGARRILSYRVIKEQSV